VLCDFFPEIEALKLSKQDLFVTPNFAFNQVFMKREDGALLKTLDCMDAIPEPIGTYLRRVEKEYHLWNFYWIQKSPVG